MGEMRPSAFERAGARARGVESLEEPDRGTSASVGTRTLVPFGICLLAIVVVVGLGATLLARESVDRELEARASTAARLLDTSIARSRARLAADAEDLARGSRGRAETGTNAREALELEVVDSPSSIASPTLRSPSEGWRSSTDALIGEPCRSPGSSSAGRAPQAGLPPRPGSRGAGSRWCSPPPR